MSLNLEFFMAKKGSDVEDKNCDRILLTYFGSELSRLISDEACLVYDQIVEMDADMIENMIYVLKDEIADNEQMIKRSQRKVDRITNLIPRMTSVEVYNQTVDDIDSEESDIRYYQEEIEEYSAAIKELYMIREICIHNEEKYTTYYLCG